MRQIAPLPRFSSLREPPEGRTRAPRWHPQTARRGSGAWKNSTWEPGDLALFRLASGRAQKRTWWTHVRRRRPNAEATQVDRANPGDGRDPSRGGGRRRGCPVRAGLLRQGPAAGGRNPEPAGGAKDGRPVHRTAHCGLRTGGHPDPDRRAESLGFRRPADGRRAAGEIGPWGLAGALRHADGRAGRAMRADADRDGGRPRRRRADGDRPEDGGQEGANPARHRAARRLAAIRPWPEGGHDRKGPHRASCAACPADASPR